MKTQSKFRFSSFAVSILLGSSTLLGTPSAWSKEPEGQRHLSSTAKPSQSVNLCDSYTDREAKEKCLQDQNRERATASEDVTEKSPFPRFRNRHTL